MNLQVDPSWPTRPHRWQGELEDTFPDTIMEAWVLLPAAWPFLGDGCDTL